GARQGRQHGGGGTAAQPFRRGGEMVGGRVVAHGGASQHGGACGASAWARIHSRDAAFIPQWPRRGRQEGEPAWTRTASPAPPARPSAAPRRPSAPSPTTATRRRAAR
ncbi:hypothetical protein HMPREF0731_0404, partial [Pseudoroseomonas cervicalis ATCC 49957]